ncbi:MAG: thiamine-phosphate kinase [Candidatus Aminicenantes bacterium RBG_13_63_10]|nr:MAG: thiamine-phosphate kinase [Candidatus Aminicenantes bacterium RBG_13_63_10]
MKLRRRTEPDLIAAIRRDFAVRRPGLVLGLGDDAAAVRPGKEPFLLTTDLLVEGSHFIRSLNPPFYLGRKSLNVNISDIAAMGGRPRYALLGLGVPRTIPKAWLEEFFAGIRNAARERGVALIGGDLSRSDKILISVTLVGEGKHPILRSGARARDSLFLSGFPGRAHAGFELLSKGVRFGRDKDSDVLIRAFLDPVPQVELGSALARRGTASAMLDMSDGLSVDVLNLCRESGCGAEVEEKAIPIAAELLRLRKSHVRDALYGGEDYGLLFSVSASGLPAIRELARKFNLTRIGRLTRCRDIVLVKRSGRKVPFKPGGFRHLQ